MISGNNLRCSYGNGNAVDVASFAIGAGEIFGQLVPNGAGNSTIIHLIGGNRGQWGC